MYILPIFFRMLLQQIEFMQASKIFINKNLTAFRRELVGKANARKEELSLLSVWTIDVKVFVQTSPEGRPIRIYSEHDLNKL